MKNRVLLGETKLTFKNVIASRTSRNKELGRLVLEAVTVLKDVGATTTYNLTVGGVEELETEHLVVALYLYNDAEEQFTYGANKGEGFNEFFESLAMDWAYREYRRLPQWLIDDVRY